jgi:hypothetical protein
MTRRSSADVHKFIRAPQERIIQIGAFGEQCRIAFPWSGVDLARSPFTNMSNLQVQEDFWTGRSSAVRRGMLFNDGA